MNQVSRAQTAQTQLALNQFMNKVYGWMAIGLLLCSLSSYYIASSPNLVMALVTHKFLFYGLLIAQIGIVLALSWKGTQFSAATARSLFIGYTLLTGVTLSVIFLAFTKESIISTFLITSASFVGLSLFGYTTKRDLGPIGTFCTMGLFGMIIVMFAGIFFPSFRGNTMQMILGAVGVIVFSGLTAYDNQRIKAAYLAHQFTGEAQAKQAIFGALTLFLDFINLFLSLLRLMGDRR
ncbi:MAG: Bax inhibitor-1/YccA family protein [Pseudomonadota bacterium]